MLSRWIFPQAPLKNLCGNKKRKPRSGKSFRAMHANPTSVHAKFDVVQMRHVSCDLSRVVNVDDRQVLVVESDADQQRRVVAQLQSRGYLPTIASSGEDALALEGRPRFAFALRSKPWRAACARTLARRCRRTGSACARTSIS